MKAKIRKIRRGFNTVELAIIISVAALLLVFVLPNFLRTSVTSNETAALTNLYKLATAFETYRALYGSYPTDFSQLRATRPALIDEKLALGQKQGYDFRISTEADIVPTYAFRIFADPSQPGKTGVRYFKIGSSTSEANGVAYYALNPPTDWAPIGITPGGTGGAGDDIDDPGEPNPCQGLCCSSCSGTGCVWTQPPCPSSPPIGGSCPYVHVWNGKEFVKDNDIIPGGNPREYTDYYKLAKAPSIGEKGIVNLKIIEPLDEKAYLDKIGLLEIIYPRYVKIAPTPEGRIMTFKDNKLFKPMTAVDSKGKNVLALVSGREKGNYHGIAGDYIIFDFGRADKTPDGLRLVLSSDLESAYAVENPLEEDAEEISGKSIHIEVLFDNKTWKEISIIHPHENWDIWAVDLTPFKDKVKGNLKVKLVWKNEHKLDFCLLDTSKQQPFEIKALALLSAKKNVKADILKLLNTSDNRYAKMVKGDEINFVFKGASIRPDKGMEKAYILASEGFYYSTLKK